MEYLTPINIVMLKWNSGIDMSRQLGYQINILHILLENPVPVIYISPLNFFQGFKTEGFKMTLEI